MRDQSQPGPSPPCAAPARPAGEGHPDGPLAPSQTTRQGLLPAVLASCRSHLHPNGLRAQKKKHLPPPTPSEARLSLFHTKLG